MRNHPPATGADIPSLVPPNDGAECAVRVDAVTRRFGPVLAVDNLSLTVEPGQTLALLGPNGAGKTTTISMLLGLSAPDAGSIEVFGAAPGSPAARAGVGAMLQDGGMMPGVLVGELLAMVRSLYQRRWRMTRLSKSPSCAGSRSAASIGSRAVSRSGSAWQWR